MNIDDENEIKKEFQLERIIFFSDAVFAIIITIMVLDVKLPDVVKYGSENEAKGAFLKILPKLLAYIFTFYMVGQLWVSHLRIFSFLKDFNMPLIVINLLFLLSVSLYPFAQSFAFTGSNFMDYDSGVYVYISIIYLSTFTQTLLAGYLIKNKTTLCVKNNQMEAVLKWRIMRVNYFYIPFIFLLMACTIYFGFTHRIFYGVVFAYIVLIRVLKLIDYLRSRRRRRAVAVVPVNVTRQPQQVVKKKPKHSI